MYINHPKTKMNCILVFFNYHAQLPFHSSLAVCLPSESSHFRSHPSAQLPCDYNRVLAKSCSICPLSSYATTLSYSIQASLWNLPSYSLTATTGSFLFPKVINYSFASRIPQSHSTPKSGNVCGRRYTKTKIQPWRPHHPILSVLPSFSGPILNPTHS